MYLLIVVLVSMFPFLESNYCVCTTVSCPVEGENSVIMGDGYAEMTYVYSLHGDYEVVVSAEGNIKKGSLNEGTETTSCTQKYARLLEDDNKQNCDAGHILANRLGGYGNLPLNIFPQNASMNRGTYSEFESEIYNCLYENANEATLTWEFLYETETNTMPFEVKYSAVFDKGCNSMTKIFENK
tara:strand:- start:3887 stop:4438 length:552 start_codon:yes stop_codon:yes gene_type:complete